MIGIRSVPTSDIFTRLTKRLMVIPTLAFIFMAISHFVAVFCASISTMWWQNSSPGVAQ